MKMLHSLCCRDKSVEMAVVLIQDFSGPGLSGRLQPDDDALWWRWTKNKSAPLRLPQLDSIVESQGHMLNHPSKKSVKLCLII